MNMLTLNNLAVYKAVLRTVLLLLVVLTGALPASAFTSNGKDAGRLYEQLVNGDLAQLKEKGKKMIEVNPDSSVMYFSAVAARYDDNLSDEEKDLCIGSLNNLGYVYFFVYNNPLKSYEYLLKALKLSEETGINTSQPHIYLNIANIFASMGENREAVKYLKKSIRSSATLHANDILVISFVGLINQIFTGEGGTFKSIGEEIKIFKNAGLDSSTELYDFALLYLAGVEAAEKGEYAAAIKSFEKALKSINTRLTPERYDFTIRSAIAKVQLLQNDFPGAIGNLHKILTISDAPDIRVPVYSQMSEAFQKRGDIDSSNHYRKLYLELSDSILHKGQLQTLHGLDNQYVTDKLNATIEKSAADRRYYLRIVGIVSAALLLILAVVIWGWISRRRLAKANRLLYEKNREDVLASEPQPQPKTPEVSETSEEPAAEEPVAAEEDAEARELAGRIAEVFATSRDVFSQEFALERLAYLTGVSVRKVSRCLNDTMNTNFINEVQKCRIREACRLFEDTEANGRLTIEAISDMVGFKSRSNFVQVFKKITGLTPSQYQKMSRER